MTDPTPARIGFAAPLTGDQAIVGVPMRQCAELAVEEINARESAPFRWKLVAEDDRADPRVAVDVARRFVDDPAVIGVVGHKNSGPSEAAAPIYAEAGLAQMTPSSTNPALSRKGYRTFFRLCAHDTRQGEEAARFAVRSLKVATVIVIHDGTSYGKPLAEVTRDTFLAEGANVVLFKGIVPGERRYPETVACIRDLRPELVYFALTEIESSILARELRAANVDAALFGTDGSRQSQFLPLAGEAAEGAYQTYAGVDPESAPTAQNFVESFNARYGPAPVYGAEVYDATRVLIDAAERADRLDRSHVLGEVAGGRFEGVTGTIRFDASGERRDAAVSVWQVREGQMELVPFQLVSPSTIAAESRLEPHSKAPGPRRRSLGRLTSRSRPGPCCRLAGPTRGKRGSSCIEENS